MKYDQYPSLNAVLQTQIAPHLDSGELPRQMQG